MQKITIENRLFQSLSFTVLDGSGKQHGVTISSKGSLEWEKCQNYGVDIPRLVKNRSLLIRDVKI